MPAAATPRPCAAPERPTASAKVHVARTPRFGENSLPAAGGLAPRRTAVPAAKLGESGETIPPELGMTPEELAELVGQLTTLNAFAEQHRDVNTACAEGFVTIFESPSIVDFIEFPCLFSINDPPY